MTIHPLSLNARGSPSARAPFLESLLARNWTAFEGRQGNLEFSAVSCNAGVISKQNKLSSLRSSSFRDLFYSILLKLRSRRSCRVFPDIDEQREIKIRMEYITRLGVCVFYIFIMDDESIIR